MDKNNRLIWGTVICIIGIILVFIPSFALSKAALVSWIYGITLFIIGIVIILNKKEDQIEQINYKGGKKK